MAKRNQHRRPPPHAQTGRQIGYKGTIAEGPQGLGQSVLSAIKRTCDDRPPPPRSGKWERLDPDNRRWCEAGLKRSQSTSSRESPTLEEAMGCSEPVLEVMLLGFLDKTRVG